MKSAWKISIVSIMALSVLVVFSSYKSAHGASGSNCSVPATVLTANILSTGENGGGALAIVSNNSNCDFSTSLTASKTSDNSTYDSATADLPAFQSVELHINVPDCQYRLDLSANGNVLQTQTVRSNVCGVITTPPPTPPPVTPTPPPVTPTPTPSVRQIISIDSVCVGGTTTIRGTNLDQTVQAFDAAGNRTTTKDGNTINAAHTVVTYPIPPQFGPGVYQVRVGPNLTDVSNTATMIVSSCGTPPPTPPPVTVSINVVPGTICKGDSATLSWTSANATSVNISPLFLPGAVLPSPGQVNGSVVVSPTTTTTYTATATNNSGGSATSSATLIVRNDCNPTQPTVSISVNPGNICRGDSSILSWVATNATSVTITPALPASSVNGQLSGSVTVSPSMTTVYMARATDSAGNTATSSATLIVRDCNPIINPVLSISKMVRDISSGTGDSKSTNANPGDTIQFTIRVSASTDGPINNVQVTDNLPAGLNYVYGSTTVDGGYQGDITSGLNLGTLSAGQTRTIMFRATVNSYYGSYYSYNSTLTNTAYASGSNVSTVSDNASVYVYSNYPTPYPTYYPTPYPTYYPTPYPTYPMTIGIQKYGKDISQGQTANQTSFSAKPGDTVEFDVIITAPSNSNLTNTTVTDNLPYGLTYSPNSTSLNNTSISDGITGGGINIDTLQAGQQETLKFYALVSSNVSSGQILTNTASVRADNVAPINSNPVQVTISTPAIIPAALHVKTGPGSDSFAIAGLGALLASGFYLGRRRILGLIKLA